MSKKGFLKDKGEYILPITRGELVFDSSGKQAFHSDSFLASIASPGLMSASDKIKLNGIAVGAKPGTVTSITPGIGLTGANGDSAITTSGTIHLKPASALELGGLKVQSVDTQASTIITDMYDNKFPIRLTSDSLGYVSIPKYLSTLTPGLGLSYSQVDNKISANLGKESKYLKQSKVVEGNYDKFYTLVVDTNDKLAVFVPWTDTQCTTLTLSADTSSTEATQEFVEVVQNCKIEATGSGKSLAGTLQAVKVPTHQYIDSKITDAELKFLTFKGTFDSVSDTCNVGDVYVIGESGEYLEQDFESGDFVVAIKDGNSSDRSNWASLNTNWSVDVINSSLNWGQSTTIATIGGKTINVKLPTKPADTNTAHTHEAGSGLDIEGDGGLTGSVKYSLKLKEKTERAGTPYAVELDNDDTLVVKVPWTDTKVTSAANHYAPTTASSVGTTSNGSLTNITNSTNGTSVITGLQRDTKGHVTGVYTTPLKSVNTYRPIYVGGAQKLANASTDALNFVNGNYLTAAWDATNKAVKYNHNTSGIELEEGATSKLVGSVSKDSGEGAVISIPQLTIDAYGHIKAAETVSFTNHIHTNFEWDGGTTAGPEGRLYCGHETLDVNFPAIPSAASNASGIVTTGTQSFSGKKSFTSGAGIGSSNALTFNTNNYIKGVSTSVLQINAPTSIRLAIGDSVKVKLSASSIIPETNNSLDLGTSTVRFKSAYFSNRVYAASGFYESSDETLKDFLQDVSVDLDQLATIPKKYFTWKNDSSKTLNIGTSAQQLQKIYPELVQEDENGLLNVAYDKLSIVALAAIDKLHAELNSLKKINQELQSRIQQLENRV